MAGALPADLIEETALTLGSVGRITLPPEQWPTVRRTLAAADRAVDTDDAGALRDALDDLRGMGVSAQRFDGPSAVAGPVIAARMTGPPPAGYGAAGSGPMPPPPVAGAPPRDAARAKRGWVWVVIGAVAAVALVGLVNTRAPLAGVSVPRPPVTSVTGAPSPTQANPTSASPTVTPTGSGARSGLYIAGGLIGTAALVIAVVFVLVRRRSRPGHIPPVHLVGPAEAARRPEPAVFTFAPNELVELANRTVDRLVTKGDGP
ncbi:MAG: CATRA system-associated protein [Mycobacterium sp.]